MKAKFVVCSILITSLWLAGCSSTPANNTSANPSNLADLQSLSSDSNFDDESAVSNLRTEALKETALTLGAQSGLATRARAIGNDLEMEAKYLRNVFNFSALMLEHGLLPPVLVEANNTVSYDGPNTLRLSDKTYKIVAQAQFVTTPPNWRNYLWMEFASPEMPNKTLLPRTKEEQVIWKEYIAIGWEQGIEQANSIFQENLARLKRDYAGMLIYRQLLAKHMISKPYVATTKLGVTGDGNSIHINDQVLRITATPQLQTNSKEWQPVVVK
jgi:defect in organelle trafficking protein DotC